MEEPADHIFDHGPESLADRLEAWGLRRFRAKQLLRAVYGRGVGGPRQMTELSKADREALAERLTIVSGEPVGHQRATDGVQKLLMTWHGSGLQTESVMIPAGKRRTACISSQVGCPVGCRFCASGLGGLDANLSAGRIVEQVWQLGRLEGVGRISHVVFMGMGEPLANFGAVTDAIRTLMADWGPNLAGRRITVSTVGVPAQIRRLADLELPVTLALSLHAPNDDLRRELIPWAQRVAMDKLLEAGRYYFDRTGREITLEYILLGGVNDRPAHARELAEVAATLRANVNLIRYNEVSGLPDRRPGTRDVRAFQAILRRAGINTHIRASRGRDIAAACGQLRHEASQQVPAENPLPIAQGAG